MRILRYRLVELVTLLSILGLTASAERRSVSAAQLALGRGSIVLHLHFRPWAQWERFALAARLVEGTVPRKARGKNTHFALAIKEKRKLAEMSGKQ